MEERLKPRQRRSMDTERLLQQTSEYVDCAYIVDTYALSDLTKLAVGVADVKKMLTDFAEIW